MKSLEYYFCESDELPSYTIIVKDIPQGNIGDFCKEYNRMHYETGTLPQIRDNPPTLFISGFTPDGVQRVKKLIDDYASNVIMEIRPTIDTDLMNQKQYDKYVLQQRYGKETGDIINEL